MLPFLPVVFFVVACIYAMAGFGGGSTYIALLAISGLPLAVVPVLALSCNLVVSSQGSFFLVRGGHARPSILIPLLVGSLPAAFLGGAWRLPEGLFLGILSAALTAAGIAMFIRAHVGPSDPFESNLPRSGVLLGVGATLGLIAGVTGIGGGIYLAPVMHLLRWASAKTITTCTSLFIALNSLAGLTGQLSKGLSILEPLPWWLLPASLAAVLVGGRIGSHLLVRKLPQGRVQLVTALVILLVAARLWFKVLGSALNG